MKRVFYFLLLISVCLSCKDGGTASNHDGELPLDTDSHTDVQSSDSTGVIANWDVVPYQIVDEPFNAGVVAFHEQGVTVTFYVNGKVVATSEAPAYNPRTDVWEYWFTLDPGQYTDGPLTLAATAGSDNGSASQRTLTPIILYANASHTIAPASPVYVSPDGNDATGNGSVEDPYASIEKGFIKAGDGGTVYLQAGEYQLDVDAGAEQAFVYWTTITAAPGVARADVVIRGNGSTGSRFYQPMVKFSNVSMYKDAETYAVVLRVRDGQHVWVENCDLYDALGHHHGHETFGNEGGDLFVTDALIRDIMNGSGGTLTRNVTYRNIGGDVFRAASNLTAININVENMDPAEDAHPDLIQFYHPDSTVSNVILYNVYATDMNAQGIFGSDDGDGATRDIAFVNILFEKTAENYFKSQVGNMNHALFWHITTVNHGMSVNSQSMRNCSVLNNAFFMLSDGEAVSMPDSDIRYNHYEKLNWNQTNGGMGVGYTTGDPLFRDTATRDFRLAEASPGYRSGTPLECVPADIFGNEFDRVNPDIGAVSNTIRPPMPRGLRIHGPTASRAVPASMGSARHSPNSASALAATAGGRRVGH